MTEFIGANPALMAIAHVGIFFGLVGAIDAREGRYVRVVTRRH